MHLAALLRRGKIVICQSYPDAGDVAARMFDLASYLLIKGTHTYVNFGDGIGVSLFPEYDLDLGAGVDPPGRRLEQGVFVRRCAKGLVLVNPRDAAVTYSPPWPMRLQAPSGGGAVPDSGVVPASWGMRETMAGSVMLPPRHAAVLLQ